MSNLRNIEAFIINFNGKDTVLTTIQSLYDSKDVKVSVSVVDDHSNDGSPELIKDHYPEVSVYRMPSNTKRANILRSKAIKLAKSEYVFVTDNDLRYDENCLKELMKVMDSDAKVAACSPRLMYWDQPDKLYCGATKIHFIGAAEGELRDKIYQFNEKEPSMNSGSGIALFRLEVVKRFGGFDEDYLQGWASDVELYQRLMRAGYKALYIPSASALHEDKLNIQKKERKFRAVGATHNRWMFILSHYSLPLIIFSIPAFILYEITMASFILIKGLFPEYIKGNILIIKDFGKIISKRKFIQKIKVVSDKEILTSGKIYMAPALIEKHSILKILINAFSSFLNFYWKIVKKIIP